MSHASGNNFIFKDGNIPFVGQDVVIISKSNVQDNSLLQVRTYREKLARVSFEESKIKISANPMREAILRTQARSAVDKIHKSSTDALLNIWTDPGNWAVQTTHRSIYNWIIYYICGLSTTFTIFLSYAWWHKNLPERKIVWSKGYWRKRKIIRPKSCHNFAHFRQTQSSID